MKDPNCYQPFHWAQRPIAEIESADLRTTLTTWEGLRQGGLAPKWRSGDLLLLPPSVVPFVSVIAVGEGQAPFDYRYFGSGLAGIHRFELTKKSTNAIEPEAFRNLAVDQYCDAIRAAAPLLFINEIPSKTEHLHYRSEVLRLPFSDDGATITHVMSVEDVKSIEDAPQQL